MVFFSESLIKLLRIVADSDTPASTLPLPQLPIEPPIDFQNPASVCNHLVELAEREDIPQLEKLIKKGININIEADYPPDSSFKRRFTPLLKALIEGKQKAAKVLFNLGAKVNIAFVYKKTHHDCVVETPLFYACKAGYFDLARSMLKCSKIEFINTDYSISECAFTAAMKHFKPDPDLILDFIEAGADLKKRDEIFPLKTFFQHFPLAQYSSLEEASRNAVEAGRTTLSLHEDSKEAGENLKKLMNIRSLMLKQLSSEKPQKVTKCRISPHDIWQVRGNKLNVFYDLYEPNSITELLSLAAQQKNIGLLRILIEAGANIQQFYRTGNHPLLIATDLGSKEMIDLFLKNGAIDYQLVSSGSIMIQPNGEICGLSRIHLNAVGKACQALIAYKRSIPTGSSFSQDNVPPPEYYEVIESLLKAGFTASYAPDFNGFTKVLAAIEPFRIAIEMGDIKLASILFPYITEKTLNMCLYKYEKSLGLSSEECLGPTMGVGMNSLFYAMWKNDSSMTQWLLEHDAHISFIPMEINLFAWAMYFGVEKIAVLLLEHGIIDIPDENQRQIFLSHALEAAVTFNNKQMAFLMLKLGAKFRADLKLSTLHTHAIPNNKELEMRKELEEMINLSSYLETYLSEPHLNAIASHIEEEYIIATKDLSLKSDPKKLQEIIQNNSKLAATSLCEFYNIKVLNQNEILQSIEDAIMLRMRYVYFHSRTNTKLLIPYIYNLWRNGFLETLQLPTAFKDILNGFHFQRINADADAAPLAEFSKNKESPFFIKNIHAREARLHAIRYKRIIDLDAQLKTECRIGCLPGIKDRSTPATQFISAVNSGDFDTAFKMIADGAPLSNEGVFSPLVYVLERHTDSKVYSELANLLVVLLLKQNAYDTLNFSHCFFKDDPFSQPKTPLEYIIEKRLNVLAGYLLKDCKIKIEPFDDNERKWLLDIAERCGNREMVALLTPTHKTKRLYF